MYSQQTLMYILHPGCLVWVVVAANVQRKGKPQGDNFPMLGPGNTAQLLLVMPARIDAPHHTTRANKQQQSRQC
eukprot:643851-Amphidinium_carterae.4